MKFITSSHRIKFNYLIVLILFPFFTVNAQNLITGNVSDSNNNPLANVNILLISFENSNLIKEVVTNFDGQFSLKIPKTEMYILQAKSRGYETFCDTIGTSSSFIIPTIILKNEENQLNDVVIKVAKPIYERKNDRLIVNVANSVIASTGSILDVLENSPGIQVNRASMTLGLNGKEDVLVMIDGKVSRQSISSLMQFLSSTNASNIEKIELITNPSAKYEANSNGGVINIITKKNSNLGINAGISINSGFGKHEKNNVSLNLNRRTEKLNVFSDLSFNRDHSHQLGTYERKIFEENSEITSKTINDRNPISNNFNGKVGIDYQISSKMSIEGSVSGFSNLWDMDAFNENTTINNTKKSSVQLENIEKGRFKNILGSINLRRKINKDSDLAFNMDYLYYQDANKTTYANTYRDGDNIIINNENLKTNKITPLNAGVAQLDYKNDLSEKLKLEFGVKGILSKLKNDVVFNRQVNGEFIVDPLFSESSNLDEQIGAVYSSTTYKFNKKTDLNVGVRYEYATTKLDQSNQAAIVNLKNSNLFPSFNFSRKTNDGLAMNLSYRRAISRPSFSDLAPFFIFLDPDTFFKGNAKLVPSISDNMQLGMKYKKLLVSFDHTIEKNAIAKYQPVILEGTNQQMFTSLNLDSRITTSVSITLPIRITSNWDTSLNVLGANTSIKVDGIANTSQKYVNINLSQNYKIPSENLTFELTGFFNSENLIGIVKTAPLYNLNFGLRKKFDNESQLSFSVNKVFKYVYNFYTVDRLVQKYSTNSSVEFESRVFKLSYSYQFGNKKLKAKVNKLTGSKEIESRMQ